MALGASTVKFSWCGRQLGFQLTPVHERKTNKETNKNTELLLRSVNQFHTTSILTAVLKMSALC